jgi:hypothetical protein
MVRRAIILLTTAVVALVGIVAVQASALEGSRDRHPPDTVLKQRSQILQSGLQGSYCWNYFVEAEQFWVGNCTDYLPRYPAGDRVEAGSRLHIKIRKAQQPDRFSLYAYRDIDGDGFPTGDAQRLSTSLKRVVRDGKTVGWDVFFYVNRPDRHYYLDASGKWNHVRGSKASYGDSSWYFHVKTP